MHQNLAPLYERAPAFDDEGKPYTDFMMLIPKMNEATLPELKFKMAGLQAVLGSYSEVVFADLNMKINILWVSLRPRSGLIEQIAVDIQLRVPEAKLVSGQIRAQK